MQKYKRYSEILGVREFEYNVPRKAIDIISEWGQNLLRMDRVQLMVQQHFIWENCCECILVVRIFYNHVVKHAYETHFFIIHNDWGQFKSCAMKFRYFLHCRLANSNYIPIFAHHFFHTSYIFKTLSRRFTHWTKVAD